MTKDRTDEESVVMKCTDFIQCFDIEGELSSGDKSQVRLKKDISPRLQRELSKFFCSVCGQEEANILVVESGINLGEILETVLIAFLRNPPNYTTRHLSDLNKSFLVLLNLREGPDDRTVSHLQDISKRILLKASMGPALYTLIFLWINALGQAGSPTAYNEEWSRRAHQVSSFLKMEACFRSLGGDDTGLRYTLQDVYDSGNGRISEIVCKWLLKLGAESLSLSANIDGFKDAKELTLVTKCSEFFPKSMDCNVLLVHLCWEELQRWQRDRDNLGLLETALTSLSSIACPGLRNKFSNLIWRSFFSKLFRDLAKRTDDFRKTTLNESVICDKEFGIKRDNVAALLSLLLGFVDKNLDLVKHGDNIEIAVDYDEISLNHQLHLLDHVKSTGLPDLELLSLEQQVAAVLFLTWRLKLPSRPLKVFSSVEINNLLCIQSTAVVSWFSDYNASVKKERVSWMEMATETSTGYIHTTPDNQLDTTQYRTLVNIVLQLAKVWFISGEMKVRQCTALYQSGFDSLGAEVRNSLDGKSRVCEALLEVALLRLAKYLYQDTDAGRIAAVPSQVMTEVAARRSMSGSVADSSLDDTLSLFLWLTEVLESDDTQLLATQCVSAVQVLQVRRNRLGD